MHNACRWSWCAKNVYQFLLEMWVLQKLRNKGGLCLVLLLGTGFQLLRLVEAFLVVSGMEAGQQLTLPDGLQVQVSVVVLAENGRELTRTAHRFHLISYSTSTLCGQLLLHDWLGIV